ncbi:hypothetical protein LCGC14_0313630 [marine sediment metagenome]|uniref:Uncharacterized protein n=1 Tax=marine sediment metagenome TaxID=412755 RepID=A0A0F9W8T8_9ZZZZ
MAQLGWGVGKNEEDEWVAFVALIQDGRMIPIFQVALHAFEGYIEEREHMRSLIEPIVPPGRFGEFLHQTEVLRPVVAHLLVMVEEGASESSIIAQLAEYEMDTEMEFEDD